MITKIFSRSVLIVILPLLSSVAAAHEGHDISLPSSQPSADSIYNLDSKWTNQAGETILLTNLKGRPAIIAMIYTSCQSACPLIVQDMKKIEEGIPKNLRHKIQFAVFSFDTARDNPAALKKYAKDRKLGSEWILAQGNSKAVRELAAVLGVQYKRLVSGDFEHSNQITLLDSEGVVKQQQSGIGNGGDELAKAATQLIK